MDTTAQSKATVCGEYYLQGVMETASGLKLNEDSSFEFFFSYGALDRSGHGTWKFSDGKVVLTSPVPPSQALVLAEKRKKNDGKLTIKIREENPFFRSHVYAIVASGGKQLEGLTDKDGMISFPGQAVDSIVLLFEFAPEKTAIFPVKGDENYFEFTFDPSVLEVIFNNLSLVADAKSLTGQHPLLKEGQYHFIKN